MNKKAITIILAVAGALALLFATIGSAMHEPDQNNKNEVTVEENKSENVEDDSTKDTQKDKEKSNADKNSVSYNGKLHVSGNKILNQYDEEIQLTGISTHGIQWFGELYNRDAVSKLKNEFGINVFRIAMYTDTNASGYVANQSLKNLAYELIDAAIAEDIYVIMDWHILSDNNPQIFQYQAKEFFNEVTQKYAGVPNVIYEICNEPNGGDVTWEYNVYPYAEDVLATIRKNEPDALVIVGTADWSKDLASAAKKPLNDKNVAYSLHFYAGTHNDELRQVIDEFRSKNLAVFVSECGATDASGGGAIYKDNFNRWVDYMKDKKISWVYWSYTNKDEGSAILEPNYVPNSSSTLSNHLSESGKLVKDSIQRSKQ